MVKKTGAFASRDNRSSSFNLNHSASNGIPNVSKSVLRNKKSKHRRKPGTKLAPLDTHETSAGALGKASRKIAGKKDLVQVVRGMNPSASTGSVIGMQSSLHQDSLLKSSSTSSLTDVSSQLHNMETEVNLNARRFNELKILGDQKEKELAKKKEILKARQQAKGIKQEQRATAFEKMTSHEKDLQEMAKKTEKVLHYRRVLDHMLTRLASNEITFDAHINSMEAALEGARKEAAEVKLLTRQVEAGKNRAIQEAKEVHRQVKYENRERLKLLEGKERALRMAQKIEQSRADQWEKTLEMIDQKDMSTKEEAHLRKALNGQNQKIHALQHEYLEQENLAKSLENWFQQVKLKTGVLSPDEMVEKFMGQNTNKIALQSEKQMADKRLERAKRLRKELEEKYADQKASGTVKDEITRDHQDRIEMETQKKHVILKATIANYERLEGVLMALRQGSIGLYQRLIPYKNIVEKHEINLTMIQSNMMGLANDDNVALKNLHLSELILSKMIEAVGGGEGTANSPSQFGATAETEGSQMLSTGGAFNRGPSGLQEESWLGTGTLGSAQASPNNIRVLSVGQKNADASDYRHQRQYFSESESSDEENGTGEVMSRHNHKMVSISETQRKTEQALKKKKAQERAERLAMADDKERDALTSVAAKVKAQAESTERLTKFRSPPGLPEGITVKDDPMTKTHAFLTQMPDLL
mmetsp:Transcript_20439/g.25812  ORF Transcript_20439/g.25812 Transcript_20439/m.25812 type:complete len:701 (+) Transcript_20439:122-2224(+)